VAEWQTRQP